MQPLEITIQAAGTEEELCSNIRSALSRNLPELTLTPTKHDGNMVLVASGWSMPNYIDEIKAHRKLGRPIVAIKAAHDFLVENGVEPDLWVNLDPRDRTSGIQRLNDHTVYMPASRCPPSTFDHLKGRKILLWHSWSPGAEMEAMGLGKLAVGGGTTSGLRAINIGYLLGFRKFTLYGYDSCNRADGVKRFTGEVAVNPIEVVVGESGKKFSCSTALAQQANEFQQIYGVMPDISITAVGPGLIAAIIDERKKLRLVA